LPFPEIRIVSVYCDVVGVGVGVDVGVGVGVLVTGGVVVTEAWQDITEARDKATAIAVKISALLLFIAMVPPYTVAGSARNTL
jgi:hypothetical protein